MEEHGILNDDPRLQHIVQEIEKKDGGGKLESKFGLTEFTRYSDMIYLDHQIIQFAQNVSDEE